jgi:hypothetical protein
MSDVQKLVTLLKEYNFDDLQKCFFTLSLWLPNIASPIKIQYLYTLLESIANELPKEDKILEYKDFASLCKKIIVHIPSFPMLEDYVPVADWGSVKFYFDKEQYKIFDGSDLTNTYDFHTAFELLHTPFHKEYWEILKRNPKEELIFLLKGQDYIISGIKQESDPELTHVHNGHLEIPPEEFALDTFTFLDEYKPQEQLDQRILNNYTYNYSEEIELPDFEEFSNRAFLGENCFYLYAKHGDKYYPVMPRRHIAVVYDTWGQLLKNKEVELRNKFDRLSLEDWINRKIYSFISERLGEDRVFKFASAIDDNKQPIGAVYTAIQAKDRLILIGVTKPVSDDLSSNKNLDELIDSMRASVPALEREPHELGLMAEQKIVQFQPNEENGIKKMETVFIAATPVLSTSLMTSMKMPKDIILHVVSLDQLAGIIDEIDDLEQLANFFAHLIEEERVTPVNSLLDRLGAFKGSSEVLIAGAREPDRIMLDFGTGSQSRHDSLRAFWSKYPERVTFGHPMGWKINESRSTETGFVLEAKGFFGYVFYQNIEAASFVINAPVHLMDSELGKVADPMMYSLYDALNQCIETIKRLAFTQKDNKIQVFMAPDSLVIKDKNLDHMRHLLTDDEKLWEMDIVRMKHNDFGIRVVYKHQKVLEELSKVTDRSLQIGLLVDVLLTLDRRFPDQNIDVIIKEVEKESLKPPRFKTFKLEKTVSYPEWVKNVLPDNKEYKMADKNIAVIALSKDVKPNEYDGEQAKAILQSLRDAVVQVIDEKVKTFDLAKSLPFLLEKSDAIINKYVMGEKQVKATIEHEVDYDRDQVMTDDYKNFMHWHKAYRYLIEKFVQHEPCGAQVLNTDSLKELLALTDRLMDIYSASDFIHYQMYPASVEIDNDFLVTLDYGMDITESEKRYGEEQSQLKLGLIGNNEDAVDGHLKTEDYLSAIDAAFRKDFNFGIKNLVNLLMVLSRWAMLTSNEENTSYSATYEEINKACKESITGYDESETQKILDFLVLEPEKVLIVQDKDGNDVACPDIPVWEHYKRRDRYSIRPIIKIGNSYLWSPYGTDRASRVWLGLSGKHKLPADLEAPTVKEVLKTGHRDMENHLVSKTEEICLRFSQHVKVSVYPHKIDSSTNDIGDIDVLVYLPNSNIILNIESKIIDPPYCNKDAGRMQRMTFIGEKKPDGTKTKSYTDKVLEREEYLRKKGLMIGKSVGIIGSSVNETPQVKSLFVTKMGYWWTKNPPIQTGIDFIEIQLLEDHLLKMTPKIT